MAKRIITISREFGSGGRFIGEKVAKKLGIAYYDKNIINYISLDYFKEENLDRYIKYDFIDTKSVYDTTILKEKYNLSENTEGEYDWTFDDRIAKADITVNFKDGKKSLGISAKNIGVDKIGMVDSTPLLTLLLNQNADFVTHYMNIMNYNETSSVALNNQLISDYNNMVKQIAAMKALQGLIGDKQGYSAQILIVNDRVAGQVKVVDMNKIFKNVKKDIDRYFTFQGLDNVRLANSWAGGIAPDGGVNGAMTRISNTLMELHKYKISVSMNRTALYAK